ncbi:MAG: hypothetical protein ACTSQ0_04595 [Candidatus Heimdallarchaeota archaeon]
MSFIKKWFSKKEKKKSKNQITQPIPRSGKGDSTKIPEKKVGTFTKNSAWIDRITAPSIIKRGEVLKISASGNFSDLGFKLDDGYAKVQKNKLIVSVIGAKKVGTMAGQALKPFNTVIEVKDLNKGKYSITVEKGNAKEIQVEVQ